MGVLKNFVRKIKRKVTVLKKVAKEVHDSIETQP